MIDGREVISPLDTRPRGPTLVSTADLASFAAVAPFDKWGAACSVSGRGIPSL
jgi:hypothetical protein